MLSTHLISFEGADSKLETEPETSSTKPKFSSSGTLAFTGSKTQKGKYVC